MPLFQIYKTFKMIPVVRRNRRFLFAN